ncbi:MAG: hypothetical protein L7S72_09030, partial [Flavobacteriales bacterium]|nr:hypothetical protein [Flavobacteriales bacterium]
IGLNSADSYSFIFLSYLCIAYFGAYCWSKIFLSRNLSNFAALIWTILPINVVHQKYSMVALGMVLLPAFCFIFYKFYILDIKKSLSFFKWILILLVTTTTSVFMDGYTFVMFAYFAFIAWFFLSMLEVDKLQEKRLVYQSLIKLMTTLFVFFTSFCLYNIYFPGFEKWIMPIEFYRAWGLDLSFLIIPTRGENLIFDFLNLSIYRSQLTYFGDSSVWVSTYSLPIIIGLFFSIRKKNKTNLFYLLLFISLTSLYFAMGPSLKFFSNKPDPELGQFMASQYAVFSTGSELLYLNLPGFKAMRATYRWTALFLFASWLLTVKGLSELHKFTASKKIKYLMFILIFGLLMPNNMFNNFSSAMDYRKMSNEFEKDLSVEISEVLSKDEVALFLPLGNNFIVNFLASNGDFKAYNIGGDKNVMLAQQKLPDDVKDLNNSFINSSSLDYENFDYDALHSVLMDKNVIILPYFSMTFPTNDYIYKSYCFKSLTTSNEYLECISNNLYLKKYQNFINSMEGDKRFELIKKNMFLIIKNS